MAGNTTAYAASLPSVVVYSVTRTTVENTTLTVYLNGDTSTNVTASPVYVTSGTPMYISASPTNQSATLTTFTVNGTDKKSSAGGFEWSVSGNVAIVAESKSANMSSATYMQDVTESMCQESTKNTVYTLTDRRDSKNISFQGSPTIIAGWCKI